MSMLRRRGTLVVGLVAVLVMGIVMPAAAYTKLYRFTNNTGVPQFSVKAITQGLESITSTDAYPDTWAPGAAGYTVIGGAFCTSLTYGGPARSPGTRVYISWDTADGSCRLRDLRWGGGQVVVPYYAGGVPGGGMVFYDWPNPGDLTVVITNDSDGVISLSDVEFAVSGYELSLQELAGLLDTGLVEVRVASIDNDIEVLRAEVDYYGSTGALPSPSANSLIGKLDRAAAYKDAGLTACLGGAETSALAYWAKAAKQIQNFISEVTNISDKGNLAPGLYDRWIVDGGGQIATAPEILNALLALPEGQALQSLDPLPCGALPAYPGLDPADCVEWPVSELYPGQYTAFVAHNVDLGAGFIMGGSVVDEDGNVLLEWLEQPVAEPAVLDTEPPVITSVSATPAYLWPPDHTMTQIQLEVTVSDNSYAMWYVADVASNQPENGTGDGDYAPDWVVDPDNAQSLWLRAERSGSDPTAVRLYTVTLMAIDMAGNLSEPYQRVIPVDHDMGG
jgi:hypothetical protein